MEVPLGETSVLLVVAVEKKQKKHSGSVCYYSANGKARRGKALHFILIYVNLFSVFLMIIHQFKVPAEATGNASLVSQGQMQHVNHQ